MLNYVIIGNPRFSDDSYKSEWGGVYGGGHLGGQGGTWFVGSNQRSLAIRIPAERHVQRFELLFF